MKRLLPFIVGLFILASFYRLGGLFLMLLFFAAIVWGILKINAKTTPGDPKNLPLWRQRLQKAVLEIRQELHRKGTQQPSQTTGWELLMPQDAQVPSPPEELVSAETVGIDGASEKRPQEKAGKEIVDEAAICTKKRTKLAEAGIPAPIRDGTPPLPREPAVTTSPAMDLENAVIWSEIISPPLALRGDRE